MMHAARQRSLALDQQLPPTVDAAAAAVAGEGDTMMVDGVAPSATATTVCSSAPPEEEGGAEGLPAVIDELLPRVLHCCCEDTWQVCVGGGAAYTSRVCQSGAFASTSALVPHCLSTWLPTHVHTLQARLAGAAAVKLLIHRLPDHYLRKNAQVREM